MRRRSFLTVLGGLTGSTYESANSIRDAIEEDINVEVEDFFPQPSDTVPPIDEVYLEVFDQGDTSLTVLFEGTISASVAEVLRDDPKMLYSLEDDPESNHRGPFVANEITVSTEELNPSYALGSDFYRMKEGDLGTTHWYYVVPITFNEEIIASTPNPTRFQITYPTGFSYDLPQDQNTVRSWYQQEENEERELFQYSVDSDRSIPPIVHLDHPALTALLHSATFRHELLSREISPEDEPLSTLLDLEWYANQSWIATHGAVAEITEWLATASVSAFITAPLSSPVQDLLRLDSILNALAPELQNFESSLESSGEIAFGILNQTWMTVAAETVEELEYLSLVEYRVYIKVLAATFRDELAAGSESRFRRGLEEYRTVLESQQRLIFETLFESPFSTARVTNPSAERNQGGVNTHWDDLYQFTRHVLVEYTNQIDRDLELLEGLEEDASSLSIDSDDEFDPTDLSPDFDPDVRTSCLSVTVDADVYDHVSLHLSDGIEVFTGDFSGRTTFGYKGILDLGEGDDTSFEEYRGTVQEVEVASGEISETVEVDEPCVAPEFDCSTVTYAGNFFWEDIRLSFSDGTHKWYDPPYGDDPTFGSPGRVLEEASIFSPDTLIENPNRDCEPEADRAVLFECTEVTIEPDEFVQGEPVFSGVELLFTDGSSQLFGELSDAEERFTAPESFAGEGEHTGKAIESITLTPAHSDHVVFSYPNPDIDGSQCI